MMKNRASGIAIQGNTLLFMRQRINNEIRHVFVGGGIESGESPDEAMKRELMEEMNIDGEIVYGPVTIESGTHCEYVFVIELDPEAEPTLGYDPELPADNQDISGILSFDAQDKSKFNAIDRHYFEIVLAEAKRSSVSADWVNTLKDIIS